MAKKDMEIAEKNFKQFEDTVNSLTLDRMNEAPVQETEPQTKLSQKDLEKAKETYLKPKRTISSREKFNERFRDQYNFQKEYVRFIAENKEIIGEDIDLWTKPFPGLPAEEWIIPVNRPVWGPRYLAEQVNRAKYHRLTMQQSTNVGSDHAGQYFGHMVADTTVNRLEARPALETKSIFMGASKF